ERGQHVRGIAGHVECDPAHRRVERIAVHPVRRQRDQRDLVAAFHPCIGEQRHHAFRAATAEGRNDQYELHRRASTPGPSLPNTDGSTPRRVTTNHHASPRQMKSDSVAPMAAPVAPSRGTSATATMQFAAMPTRTKIDACFWYFVMDSMKPTSPKQLVAQEPSSRIISGT